MKNIVVFIDGTGQDRSRQEVEYRTNVSRLYEACRHIDGSLQVCKYCDGVGTEDYEEFTGNAFGIGLERRIVEAYLFLQQEVGAARKRGEDFRIFLFGFSRGAFAVRWLAAVLKFSGIPEFGRSERPGLYNCWKSDIDAAERLRAQGDQYDVNVRMIGVWDTVQSTLTSDFDVPKLPDNVDFARHAMSLDEYRYMFPVTHFLPDPKRVEEVWFAGCHADVGGGYRNGFVTADAALTWMVLRAEEKGLIVERALLGLKPELWDFKPVIHDELRDAPLKLRIVWKLTNWIHLVNKAKRRVDSGGVIHSTVRKWKEKFDISHFQDMSECQIYPEEAWG